MHPKTLFMLAVVLHRCSQNGRQAWRFYSWLASAAFWVKLGFRTSRMKHTARGGDTLAAAKHGAKLIRNDGSREPDWEEKKIFQSFVWGAMVIMRGGEKRQRAVELRSGDGIKGKTNGEIRGTRERKAVRGGWREAWGAERKKGRGEQCNYENERENWENEREWSLYNCGVIERGIKKEWRNPWYLLVWFWSGRSDQGGVNIWSPW